MYTTDTRNRLAARVYIETPAGVPTHIWAQRGTAFLLSAPAL
jgi:hypothetical protein